MKKGCVTLMIPATTRATTLFPNKSLDIFRCRPCDRISDHVSVRDLELFRTSNLDVCPFLQGNRGSWKVQCGVSSQLETLRDTPVVVVSELRIF